MDDLYGTDPVADDAKTRTPPTMTTPCYACKRPVDINQQYEIVHPFGRTTPKRVLCSDACYVDYCIAVDREARRVS